MNEIHWSSFFAGGLFTGAFVAVLGFVCRNVFNKYLEKWFFERQERFKTELENIAFEYRTRFNELHLKRAQIIGELHGKLYDFSRLVHDLGGNLKEEEMQDAMEKFRSSKQALYDYFFRHSVYFTKSTVIKFRVVMFELDELAVNLRASYTTRRLVSTYEPTLKRIEESLKKAELAFADTEDEFRKLLGMSSD